MRLRVVRPCGIVGIHQGKQSSATNGKEKERRPRNRGRRARVTHPGGVKPRIHRTRNDYQGVPVARVAVYVDGFNLYFGLKAKHGRRYLWLDLQALAESLLRPGQTLERVMYFTARVRKEPDAARRQSDYLDALACHSPLVRIVDGHFQERQRRCWQCGSEWLVHGIALRKPKHWS